MATEILFICINNKLKIKTEWFRYKLLEFWVITILVLICMVIPQLGVPKRVLTRFFKGLGGGSAPPHPQ